MKMCRNSLLIVLLLFVVMPTFAQNVLIEYSEKINTDVPTQLSLKLDNKTYLKIDGHSCNYIPMETYVDQTFTVNDEIPLFAVTGGVSGTLDFMGSRMNTQDYCGLRDKFQHPKEWVNVDGVHDYCFYTIEFH